MTLTRQEIVLHTPGPWVVGPWIQSQGENVYCIVASKKRSVSAISVYGKRLDGTQGGRKLKNGGRTPCVADAECEADARLIAAAPDLLALAKRLAGECAECHGRGYTFGDDGIVGFGPDDLEPTREACAECADIREVIAKAEGRS